jgi:uncharacterized membrane protein YdjX (TVP38/TMEM64 family)
MVQLLVLALVAGVILWAFRNVEVVDHIHALEHRVAAMGNQALLFFPLLIAACNILMLPGGILAASAGLFFGLWWGATVVLVGNLIGAATAFFISRRFARSWLEPKLMSNPKLRAIDEAVDREGWKIIFFTQLHPVSPTSLLNYLYGFTRIRFWPCMFWIVMGQIPGIFLYVYLGTLTQLGIAVMEGEAQPKTSDYWTWIGGLVTTVIVTVVLGRVALKVLAQAQRAGEDAK